MSEQAALDKKAIRKEILALIIPIILESIFVYLAGIVSASLIGHLSGLAVATPVSYTHLISVSFCFPEVCLSMSTRMATARDWVPTLPAISRISD